MRKSKPAAEQSADFHMLMPPQVRVKLDNLRRKEADFPPRSEMIRRLIERAK